ncbi:MAG: hypothetical protein ACJ75Z_09970 [Solirubrobacterales bacterium]
MAGAAFFAVPVAVAALIGFGTSLSGVAGGLSAVTTGPDTAPASQATPTSLTSAVVGLATTQRSEPSDTGSAAPSADAPLGSDGVGTVNGSDTSSGTGSNGGNGGSPGVIAAPNTPNLGLPGGGGGSSGNPGQDTVNGVGNGVNDVLGNVDNSLQGLLGR